MIKVRIQIGEGSILDSESGYGLIYLSSDNILEAPQIGRASCRERV